MIAWRVTSPGHVFQVMAAASTLPAEFSRFPDKPFAFKQNPLRFVSTLSIRSHVCCSISPLSAGLLADC